MGFIRNCACSEKELFGSSASSRWQLAGCRSQSQARFSIAQHERYERYSQLLNAARGIYRSDSVMLAALDKFRRRLGRRGVETETPPESSISKAA